MLARLKLPLPELPVRRTRAAPRGHRIDLRATLRGMTGAAGAVAPLAFRAPHRAARRRWSCCATSPARWTATRGCCCTSCTRSPTTAIACTRCVFGTRLTNITRHLRHRDVDVALARVAGAVEDWAGGTRIGACLARVQPALVAAAARAERRRAADQRRPRRARPATGLAFEMERLAKSCARLVWLNPLLRYADFEARPAGIRAMLPHVDDFLPVHNLASLTALAAALSRPRTARRARTRAQAA